MTLITRRHLLKTGVAAAAGVVAAPAIGHAQSKEPIPIGALCPLTGAGGAYGPDMQKAIVAVAERINKSGGIHGRPIQIFPEDSQTNPEAAVRAARKLFDVNHVVAVMSTWASAVTLAVKPLAVEAKVFYFSVSGADAVTEGNHGGYIARTQPNTKLQGQVYAKWVLSRKEWKRVTYMALQTPFAVPFGELFMGTLKTGGVTITDNLIYEDKKPSYRSEITRVLATNPDLIMLEGYSPDSVVIAKELYRLSYKGAILGPAFAINAKFIEGAGADVAEGIWAIDPSPSFDSPAYKQFVAAVPTADKNPYAPQAWDHMTMVGLALAAGHGEASGTVVKDNLRTISNPPGTAVSSYEEGARLLREGKKINYEGASGSCDFDAQGDILSRPFGVYQVRQGKVEQVSIINP
ncbi:MAG TPA: ABC transporter substrate-binding protein [Candidatus Methylomirabilis sp.]|nr:ABC transporter substrate-binding protein [Candidatus Methylomirabilis sp.]